MKKRLIAALHALAIAFTLTLTSCGKGGGDVKLLESITDDYGEVIIKFEYDKQNRLVKIGDMTITYNSNNLVTAGGTEYVIKGNTIRVEKGYVPSTLTIDKDGYIVKKLNPCGNCGDDCTYQYNDGNLTQVGIRFYGYDDKKSPFSNSNTPKWLLQLYLGDYYANKNNVLSNMGDGDDGCPGSSYEYEYDSEGFPIKKTEEACIELCTTTISHFVYSGRTAEEVAAFDAARQAVKKEMLAEKAANISVMETYVKEKREKALKEGQTLTDERDGKIYVIVKIGGQTWMAENLNYETKDSKCYENNPDNCQKYGRLYYYGTAVQACPKEWHLSSYKEWQILVDFAGGNEVAGNKLKAKYWWNMKSNDTDNYGFSALPGGYSFSNGNFSGVGNDGSWWGASEDYVNDFHRKISTCDHCEDIGISDGDNDGYLYSVRCINDYGKLTDTRDSKVYKTVRMPDGKTWMAENLNYKPKEGSWCYENKEANCKKYGRLYNWKMAAEACPSGWHLSSFEEWEGLAQAIAGKSKEDRDGLTYWEGLGKKLKAKSGWSKKDGGNGTDNYGFSALPGGSRAPDAYIEDDGSNEFRSMVAWWNSTDGGGDVDDTPRFFIDGNNLSLSTMGRTDEGHSVRCVRD